MTAQAHNIPVWSLHALMFKLNPGRQSEKRPSDTQTPGRVSASKDKHILSGFMSSQEHNHIYFNTQLPECDVNFSLLYFPTL